jgi:outer membrane protein assembly factor BamB
MDPWDFHHSSPYFHDGVVYIGTEQGILWGFEARSGERLLRCQTLSEQTIRTTPVVWDNLILYGDWDGVLYANDISNGSLAWKYDTKMEGTYAWPNSILSSLAIYENQVYFAGKSNRLYSLDVRTGRKNWHYSSPTDQWLIGGPVLTDGVVYLGSSDQHLFHAIDASSGELLWSTGLDCRIWGTALIKEGLIYIGSNSLFTLEKGSGKILRQCEFPQVHEEMKYGEYTDRSANFHSSPVLFHGMIILGSDDGHIYAIQEL